MNCQYCKQECVCPWKPDGPKDIKKLSEGWGTMGAWIEDVEKRLQLLGIASTIEANWVNSTNNRLDGMVDNVLSSLGPWIEKMESRMAALESKSIELTMSQWREWATSHKAVDQLRSVAAMDGFEIKVIARRIRNAESERIGQR